MRWLFASLIAAGALSFCLAAQAVPTNLFARVGFDQRLNQALPLDATFRDEAGRPVPLRQFFGTRPVVLVLGYYQCPNLCGAIWLGLLTTLRQLQLTSGRDYEVVAISIDPHETPAIASAKKQAYLRNLDPAKAGAGWHFLTGDENAIARVSNAAGFRYVYDPNIHQYAHVAGLVVATPAGTISRYLFGIRYAPSDLRLALVEASGNRIGSPVDQLLLLCFHYDPATGKYSLLVTRVVRGASVLTALAVIGGVVVLRRRERAKPRPDPRKEPTA